MNKKIFYIIVVLVLLFAITGILYHITHIVNNEASKNYDTPVQEQETQTDKTKEESNIVEISLDAVYGITQKEAEELCYYVLGEKDENTGFPFSLGVSGAVQKGNKQYYVIRASWLVNNSHMSYIGDFFVSLDGKEIYNGTALQDEYIMQDIIWSE